MHKELPIYLFIRNSAVLCILFFLVSAVIIERGRHERGENSLFNNMIFKQKNIIDYNYFDASKTIDSDPINAYVNLTEKKDSTFKSNVKSNFSVALVENTNKKMSNLIQIDL